MKSIPFDMLLYLPNYHLMNIWKRFQLLINSSIVFWLAFSFFKFRRQNLKGDRSHSGCKLKYNRNYSLIDT